MSQNPYPRRKTEKAAFPPSTHKPGTAHQKSPQAPEPEPPVQRTAQETPRHCGRASRAADRSCLEARQRGRYTNVSECPGITSKEQLPGELRKITLGLIAGSFLHNVWTHVYTDGTAEEEMKMAAAESTSVTQMATPLPSRFLVDFSAPTVELKYWPFSQLQSTC